MTLHLPWLAALRGMLARYVLIEHGRWLLWIRRNECNRMTTSQQGQALGYSSVPLRLHDAVVRVLVAVGDFFARTRFGRKPRVDREPTVRPRDFCRSLLYRLRTPYLLVTLFRDAGAGGLLISDALSTHSGLASLD